MKRVWHLVHGHQSGLKSIFEIAVEQRRIRRRRQRRGAVHGGFDRFAHRLVAVALPDSYLRHFASRDLRHVQHAFYSRTRRRRAQPRALDLGGDLRFPVRERRRPSARSARSSAARLLPQIRLALGLLLGLPPARSWRSLLLRAFVPPLPRLGLALAPRPRCLPPRWPAAAFCCAACCAASARLLLRGGLLPACWRCLLALRQLLRRRLRRSDGHPAAARAAARLPARGCGAGCGVPPVPHARVDHPRLDRQRRCRPRRPPEHQPAIHQRSQQRGVQQHRQRYRHPAIARPSHGRGALSSVAMGGLGQADR